MQVQKFNVKFSESTYQVLGNLSKQFEMPMADVLREAISVLWFITREMARGNKLLIQRGNEVTELVFPNLERVRDAEESKEQDASNGSRRGRPQVGATA